MATISPVDQARLQRLRRLITESIRIQQDTVTAVDYVDTGSTLQDVSSRQNHVIFGRRGCGKSLLLHSSARQLPPGARRVYLNCEDFKHHSFPNVLIEIVDAILSGLDTDRLPWFGKRRRRHKILQSARKNLAELRKLPDERDESVRRSVVSTSESSQGGKAALGGSIGGGSVSVGIEGSRGRSSQSTEEIEFRRRSKKLETLNRKLPEFKDKLRLFLSPSTDVVSIFVHLDDFYHLKLVDQPFVIDYVHRLCKDLPLYFKVATLQHSSSLFIERDGQPVGAQQRHDYLPINIDFTFEDFERTEREIQEIFHAYGELAGITNPEMDSLFKGEGFRRLVVVAGGVPRDCLSLFLEALDAARQGDGRIGKDTMRLLSLATFESRIKELKEDAQETEQDRLLRGIYAIRELCLGNKTNAFVVEERELRDSPSLGELLNQLLDYRIIHSAASAFTHKTYDGTYRAFVIDAGCYAFMRKLHGKLHEIDVSDRDAKERMRSAPKITAKLVAEMQESAPSDVEPALKADEPA